VRRKIGDVNGVDVFCGTNINTAVFDNCIALLKLSSFEDAIESRRVLLISRGAESTQSAKHADDGGGIFGEQRPGKRRQRKIE